MFNFEEIKDFESHISLSIPNYDSLCNIFRAFTLEYSSVGGNILDIGCSVGSFLASLPERDGIHLVGNDIVDIRKHYNFAYTQETASSAIKSNSWDVILSMFTLQFLGKHERKKVVELMKQKVEEGSVCLIAEKVMMPTEIEHVLKKEHIQQKRQHFSDTEILNKERDLFGSMQCVTLEKFQHELNYIGQPYQVWQNYNFVGYLVK